MNSPTLSVSLLRAHSEQLRQLATALREDLSQLRLALSEQEGACDTEALGLGVGAGRGRREIQM